MTINTADFQFVRTLLERESGIVLADADLETAAATLCLSRIINAGPGGMVCELD